MTPREVIPAEITDEHEGEVSAAFKKLFDDLRAFQARAGQGPWRPIETAPKDGTTILGWWGTECIIVDWCVVVERWASTHDTENLFLPEPTHWMPLPEGPKIK